MRVPPAARAWAGPNKLFFPAMLPVLWFLFTLALSGPTRSAAQEPTLHFPRSHCQPGAFTSTVTFQWVPPTNAIEQWIHLSTQGDGFEPGTYRSAGPFSGSTRTFEWRGIHTGEPHFWRVDAYTDEGWVWSEVGSFLPCDSAQMLEPIVDCFGAHAAVTFQWVPHSGRHGLPEQWLDLSVYDNDFAPGTYLNAGPFFLHRGQYTWHGLLANVEHAYRIAMPTPAGWVISPAHYVTPSCDYERELPCNDILAPVNKQHRLPSNCVPADLVQLPAEMTFGGAQFLIREAADALSAMLAEASAAGHHVVARSTYRSFEEQAFTFNHWASQLGEAEAARISARPGHSEHQLGTAVDLTSAAVGFDLWEAFGDTPEGRWLAENAWRFGYVISYPASKEHVTGYAYEPWHLRYVGTQTAASVRFTGLTLHEYLLLHWYR